jgi:hypothetical protein
MSKLLRTEHVRFMPRELNEDTLYISLEYEVAIHLCACGCRGKTVTPLDESGWRLSENGAGATLSPSISNASTCGAHYWIRDGKVVLA